MTAKTVEISDAEWQIMRVVWTLQQATSRQIIDNLAARNHWKEATIKTLLRRLVQKEVLATTTQKRSFVYHPLINEQEAIDLMTTNVFEKICQMHVGSALRSLVKQFPLTRTDISALEAELKQKYPTAPEQLPCDCLPAMHLDYHGCSMTKDKKSC
ncbi:CopY/TcrY family copper transport repressor [Liquorilactobacillus sicerae]|uniref:CopY/TcrY family copper transport repressor n=1 Tax=Liquorilactobacillus sicerae TaxID=1416943 RepID=UPI002480B71F|nr:CopY/TcrY family copper transport repressor [Liquorilactobacillus sicerae]